MDKKKPMKAPLAISTPFTIVSENELTDTGSSLNDQYVSGKKAGSMVHVLAADGSYVLYKSLGKEVDSGWEIVGDSTADPELPAIWTLKDNVTGTVMTADTPTVLKADITNKFNAVETEYLGNMEALSATDMVFTAGQGGDYEFQVRGVVEDATNAMSKMAFVLMDDANNSNLTGSMFPVPAAYAWGGTNEFSFICTGLLRMNPADSVSLLAISDANGTVVLKEAIVTMTRLN